MRLLPKIYRPHTPKHIVFFLLVFCVLGLLLALILFSDNREPISPKKPPITTAKPEIKLLSVEPAPGPRTTIDGFSFTAFEFSAPIDPALIVVRAEPYIALKKTVFPDRPNILYIEPQSRSWDNGVSYTIIINKGIIGLNNEELKQDIVYTFSNTVPEYIELPGPI